MLKKRISKAKNVPAVARNTKRGRVKKVATAAVLSSSSTPQNTGSYSDLILKLRQEAEEQAMLTWLRTRGEARLSQKHFYNDSKPLEASRHVIDLRKESVTRPISNQVDTIAPKFSERESRSVQKEEARQFFSDAEGEPAAKVEAFNFLQPKSGFFHEPTRNNFEAFPEEEKYQSVDPEINEPEILTVEAPEVEVSVPQVSLGFAPKRAKRKFVFLQSAGLGLRLKTMVVFMGLAMMVVFPVKAYKYYQFLDDKKGRVLGATTEAMDHFTEAKNALKEFNIDGANAEFQAATKSFLAAEEDLNKLNLFTGYLLEIIPGKKDEVDTAQNILQMGKDIGKGGEYLTIALEALKSDRGFLTDKLKVFSDNLDLAYPHVRSAVEAMKKVDESYLPEDKRAVWKEVSQGLPLLQGTLAEINLLGKTSLDILGYNQMRRYVVLNQDNWELRATGGFIGSLAEVDFDRGQIRKINIPGGGAYDLSGQLTANIVPPDPLKLLKNRWEVQDANWYPDFALSSQKFLYLYDKSGGPTVDGVIAWNASTMQKILTIIGSIDMPEYGKTITADNFFTEILESVEVEYDREENQPKKILRDMAPKVLEKIFAADSQQLLGLISLLSDSLDTKELQMYFTDPTLERVADYFGWTGKIKEPEKNNDYLNVVFSNLGGYKSDGVIDNKLQLDTQIQGDGSILNTLTITRTHNGVKSEQFTGKRNVCYLQVYVPEGSEIISANGFDVVDRGLFEVSESWFDHDPTVVAAENSLVKDAASGTDVFPLGGKTVFGNWSTIDVGVSKTMKITYKLPFRLVAKQGQTESPEWVEKAPVGMTNMLDYVTYGLLVQKQSGITNDFIYNINFPKAWQVYWSYPQNFQVASKNDSSTVGEFSAPIDRDKFFGVIMVPH